MTMRHHYSEDCVRLGAVVIIVLGILLAAAPPASAEPTLSEKMLPAGPIFAVILKNPTATAERWRTTALYEVLQDTEMKEMLKPLRKTLGELYAKSMMMSPVSIASLDSLVDGEAGLAVSVVMGQDGFKPTIQFVSAPKDMPGARQAAEAFLNGLVLSGMARQAGKGGDTTLLDFQGKMTLTATFKDNVALLTLCPPAVNALHAQTLARRTAGTGGLADDAEYAAVRKILDDDFEGWAYVGALPWARKTMGVMNPAAPFLSTLGLSQFRGMIAGIKIEDRGFRTRAFARTEYMEGQVPATMPPITAADLAMVPADVVGFSMGPLNLVGLYDQITKSQAVGIQVQQAVAQFERMAGLNLRNDILAVFGKRFLHFTPEASSPGGEGPVLFVAVDDRKTAETKLTTAMNGIVTLIRNQAGPQAEAFVRIQTLDRGTFTQIYPQSVLPGTFTPILTVADKWMGMGLSARATLPMTRYFLRSDRSGVASRADFAEVAGKVPDQYYAISYTDVGQCFGHLLGVAQFLTDVGAIGLKVGVANGEFPLPADAATLWSMDPGRFPGESLFRDKLFGSVSVVSQREDGILFENVSPVGPIPVPHREFKAFGGQNQIATASILAGMLLPALARARDEARSASSASNMMQIMKAIVTYQEPNADQIPPTLADLVPAYIDNPRVFIAPWDDHPFTIKNGYRCSYRYIGRIPFEKVGINQFIIYEQTPRNGQRAVGHFDCHVKRYPEAVFQQELARQRERFREFMKAPDFPGDKERVKAFFEDRDFAEQ